MEGKSAPSAISPKPGSPPLPEALSPLLPADPGPALSAPLPAPLWPAPDVPAAPPPGMPPEASALPDEPALLELPPEELPELPLALPELPLEPPALELLEPALPPPPLEVLAPELPVLEPPPLGDEAPELEEGEGGVGTEGVVGVLAEGQPASINKTTTKPSASSGRSLGGAKEKDAYVIVVAVPCLGCQRGPEQRTRQSYRSQQVLPPRIVA